MLPGVREGLPEAGDEGDCRGDEDGASTSKHTIERVRQPASQNSAAELSEIGMGDQRDEDQARRDISLRKEQS